MRRGDWAGSDVLGMASESGIIRVATVVSFGVSRSTIASRCKPGGPWRRVLPGIVQLTNGQPTVRQRVVAALMYCGDDAVLTGRAALREYGFGQDTGDVHVLIRDRRRVQSVAFVRVERTTRLPRPELRSRLPCAPLVRALLDAARLCTTLDRTRALIADVVQRGAVSPKALALELAEGSVRGSALVRAVIEEVTANVHSVPEAKARQLWMKSGLPEMVFNRTIVTKDGEFLAVPDGWIDSVAFAWEIDSIGWHLSPAAYTETVERRARMQGHGLVVLATVPSRVHADPTGVVSDLRTNYRIAAARPRPPVQLRPIPIE